MAKRGRPRKDPQLAERFGKNLTRICEDKFLTQVALVNLTGLKQSSIAAWFAGESVPNEKNLVNLIEILGATREELFK